MLGTNSMVCEPRRQSALVASSLPRALGAQPKKGWAIPPDIPPHGSELAVRERNIDKGRAEFATNERCVVCNITRNTRRVAKKATYV